LIVLLALGMAGIQTAPVHAATTLTVSTCDEGHLDGAVSQANSDNAGDTITFGCSGQITLTHTVTITGSMTIDGSGQSVVLDGGKAILMVSVSPGATLGVSHLTLQHGNADNAGNPDCYYLYGCGGAIYNDQGTVTITSSTLSGNSTYGGLGGAIYNVQGTVSITASTLSGNSSYGGAGGAIYNEGTMSIATSTFSGNSTSAGAAGGAIWNGGTMSITSSTLSGNSASDGGEGGAIWNGGTMTIATSTLSGNSASYSYSGGGAVYNFGGTVTITASTLSGNSAPGSSGGTIYNGGGSTVEIGGSIIANSPSGGNCATVVGNRITDLGYNLEDTSPSTCGFSSTNHDLVGSSPQLGSLASNGGPTQTMALQPTSPAIDKIPAGTLACAAGGTDQRAQSRPDVGEQSCDMGAYEYQDPIALSLSVSPGTVQRGNPVTASVTLSNPTTSIQTVTGTITLVSSGTSTMKLTLPYTLTLAAGQTVAKTVTVTVPRSFPTGTYTVTATATDSAGSASSSASLTVT
ncbi:MAG: hypothetical protein JOZ41_05520, partial [Chloroflexi bacterium]|nr:hypothetical protein [Chloroflexota bacterium]